MKTQEELKYFLERAISNSTVVNSYCIISRQCVTECFELRRCVLYDTSLGLYIPWTLNPQNETSLCLKDGYSLLTYLCHIPH